LANVWISVARAPLPSTPLRALGLTDEGEVVAWCEASYPQGTYEKDGRLAPTRTGRIMYLAQAGGVSSKVGRSVATIISTGLETLQQAKHGKSTEDLIRSYVLIVEGCIGAAITMSLRRGSDS
jgi:hypothetical protein